MKLPSLFARETGTDRLARLHALFIIYNGAVVLLLAGFLSITQMKIIETRNAASRRCRSPPSRSSAGSIAASCRHRCCAMPASRSRSPPACSRCEA